MLACLSLFGLKGLNPPLLKRSILRPRINSLGASNQMKGKVLPVIFSQINP